MLILLLPEIQLKVRSTTHLRGTMLKPRVAGRALHDFQLPLSCCMTPLGQILASIRCVCPDLFETGDEESESCEQTPSAFGIVHIGGGHVDGDGNAQRINRTVAAYGP